MSTEVFGLVLDVVVLVFLGAMIFYAIRLMNSLNAFRDQRKQFDGVIADLLSSIDQAERSINNLRQVGATEASQLGELVRKSKLIAEELRDVNQACESMAARLESLAEKNRKIVQNSGGGEPATREDAAAEKKGVVATRPERRPERKEPDLPSFMIKDREFEALDDLEERLGSSASNDLSAGFGEDTDIPDNLQSQAERELYAALRLSRRPKQGGR